jgi:hypothetical protein
MAARFPLLEYTLSSSIQRNRPLRNRDVRPYWVDGDTVFLPLTKGYVARVSLADLDIVKDWNWTASVHGRTVYACRTISIGGKKNRVWLHREILQPPPGLFVDHIDCDGLNNTRGNLRVANDKQSATNKRIGVRNTSGFKGVSWNRDCSRWQAHICVDGSSRYLGLYETPEQAHAAYAEAAQRAFGEFARVA